jgi:AcrR family transcriptional regulator
MTLSTDLIAEISDYAHGRVPRALRERQIIRLAEELFAEQGFTGASMDELARRAGVSKPVIYTLVGSKEQLYRRCVEHFSDELSIRLAEAAESESDPALRLRAGIAAFFTYVDQHRLVW